MLGRHVRMSRCAGERDPYWGWPRRRTSPIAEAVEEIIDFPEASGSAQTADPRRSPTACASRWNWGGRAGARPVAARRADGRHESGTKEDMARILDDEPGARCHGRADQARYGCGRRISRTGSSCSTAGDASPPVMPGGGAARSGKVIRPISAPARGGRMSLLTIPRRRRCPRLVQRSAVAGPPRGRHHREKSRGVWQTYDWVAYRDTVRDFALGLASLGFRRGDKLSVVGDNRPPTLLCSALGPGAGRRLGACLPRTRSPPEAGLRAQSRRTSIIVAEDQEQVDKALSLKTATAPALDHLRRPARPVVLRRPDPAVVRKRSRGRPPNSAKVNPGFYDAEMAKAGRRHLDDRLHVGHHRQPQGRHAQPS